MNFIYRHRSKLHNWKIKKVIKKNGQIYFTVHYKSIFGFWFVLKKSTTYMDDFITTIEYVDIDSAKKAIQEQIMYNVKCLGNTIDEVIEIKFDK